jgi:outer membrane protein W
VAESQDIHKRDLIVLQARSLMAILLSVSILPASASGQSLAKRHQIELLMGGWNQVTDNRTEVGPEGVETTVGSNGFVGGIAYGHWLQEDLAFRISAGLMAASIDVETSAAGVSTDFAAVVPVLFGMRYYFLKSTRGEQFRPFVGASAGSFVGSQETIRTGVTVTTESRTEVALGGEAEAGVSILLSNRVMATIAAAYDFLTDFDQPIGGSSNYSGPQITLGISLLLGGQAGDR